MKPGDLAECSIWIDGTESDKMLVQWKTDVVYILNQETGNKLRFGPVSFEIKRPGEDRVPQVPPHLSGPDVRLLIATAEVLGFETTKRTSFLNEIEERDLVKLRKATRRQHGKLSDEQCDQLIERLGPSVAAREISGQAVH